VLAFLIALLFAAPAHAASPWTDPVDVSSPHRQVWNPTLAFPGSGPGLVTWSWSDASSAEFKAAAQLGGPEKRIAPEYGLISPPVLYGTTRAVTTSTYQGLTDEDTTSLSALFGRADGSFSTERRIARRARIRSVRIAANANGDIALAWFEDRGVFNDRVYIAFRPKGKPFTPPILQATDRVRSVSIAVSPRGDLLLAYDARGVVKTRFKPARASFFRRVETIESEPAFFARLRTSVTGNGRAYVAWSAQLLTEGGETGEGFYQAAVKPAGARRFRPAQVLERRPATEFVSGLDLVVDHANRATVAWGATAVRTATTDARAVFGAPDEIAPGTFGALATAPDGRRVVAWASGSEGGPLAAAVAPAGGPFGTPELVSPAGGVPAAAFDARGNRWWLAWSARKEGTASPRMVIQASSRPT
jgi:hypothetical protein